MEKTRLVAAAYVAVDVVVAIAGKKLLALRISTPRLLSSDGNSSR